MTIALPVNDSLANVETHNERVYVDENETVFQTVGAQQIVPADAPMTQSGQENTWLLLELR